MSRFGAPILARTRRVQFTICNNTSLNLTLDVDKSEGWHLTTPISHYILPYDSGSFEAFAVQDSCLVVYRSDADVFGVSVCLSADDGKIVCKVHQPSQFNGNVQATTVHIWKWCDNLPLRDKLDVIEKFLRQKLKERLEASPHSIFCVLETFGNLDSSFLDFTSKVGKIKSRVDKAMSVNTMPPETKQSLNSLKVMAELLNEYRDILKRAMLCVPHKDCLAIYKRVSAYENRLRGEPWYKTYNQRHYSQTLQ